MLLFGILAQISKKMTKIRGSLEAEISADRPKFFFLKNFRNFPKHPPSFVALARIAIENETLHIQGTPRVQTFLFFSKIEICFFEKEESILTKTVKIFYSFTLFSSFFVNIHQTSSPKKLKIRTHVLHFTPFLLNENFNFWDFFSMKTLVFIFW